MNRFIGKAVVGTLVSLTALIGSVGSAQAATYRGTWDPAFGNPFTDLYWSGSADFFVPDTCVGAGHHANSGLCGGMTVTNAVVEFASNAAPGVTKQTLLFGSAPSVSGIDLDASNSPVGAYTSFFNAIQGAIAETQIPTGSGTQYYFALFIQGSNAYAAYWNPAYQNESCTALLQFTGNTRDCGVSGPAHITFVPEPGTYALMLAGLSAAGWVSRRRRS